jgi:DNA repair protein RadD
VIDEAHRLSPDDSTMYRRYINDARVINPNLRIIGFTATPYRLDCGPLCGPDMLFTAVAYEIGIQELIASGFLCPISSKASKQEIDTDNISIRGGEFVPDEVDAMVNTDKAVTGAVAEVVDKSQDRNAVLIFANSIKHAENIVKELFRDHHNIECGLVIGDTPSLERAATLEKFKSGELKYLVNVGVLTTGFDCPTIDMVAIMRATMSASLYVQIVGRGLRIHPNKKRRLLDSGLWPEH